MQIIPTNYRPFDISKDLSCAQARVWDQRDGFLSTAAAVGKLFIMTLLYPVTLVIDIAFSAVVWCRPRPAAIARIVQPSLPPNPVAVAPVEPPRPAQEGIVPAQNLVNLVMAAPNYSLLRRITNIQLLKDSIQTALNFNTEETKNLYKQLIQNDGIAEGGEQNPIDIFEWSAGCLLVRNLISSYHPAYGIPLHRNYPAVHPLAFAEQIEGDNPQLRQEEAREHQRSVGELHAHLTAINTMTEKASALLQIMVPSTRWELSHEGRFLVRLIKDRAAIMSRDPTFREQIYRPAADRIANL